MMANEFDKLKKVRLFLLSLIQGLSIEQLNEIPAGFNNNIIWNLGHLVSAQQGLCYVRSGLSMVTDEKYFLPYKTGTKPERFVDAQEVEEIKSLLISTVDKLEADYHQNVFSRYETFTLRYGVDITNIDDAIGFLFFHEGLHQGTIMALKHVIKH